MESSAPTPRYPIRPVHEQVEDLASAVPWLDPRETYRYIYEDLPKIALPQGASGWVVAPKESRIGLVHAKSFSAMLGILSSRRRVQDARRAIAAHHQWVKTIRSLVKIYAEQRGDFVVIAAQFAENSRIMSVRKAADSLRHHEFLMPSTKIAAALFTHPGWLSSFKEPWFLGGGDTIKARSGMGDEMMSPCFIPVNGNLIVDLLPVGHRSPGCGVVTGFLPKHLDSR